VIQFPRALRSRPYGPPQLPSAGAIAAGAAAVAVAAAGGWAVAASLTSEPVATPEARPSTVRLSASAELSLREGWQPVGKVPKLPGLDGAATRAFAPADGGSGRMVVTLLPNTAGDALPRATAAALRTPLGKGTQRATVGGLRGAAYTALALKGVDGIVDVYAVPTAAGVLAIGCVAPLDDPLPVDSCPNDIVHIAARKPAVDPMAALRTHLPGVVTSLNRTRRTARRDLREGATSKAQARAAARLAVAYRDASRRVAAAAPKTGAASTLPAAFSQAADAYDALESAARRHSKAGWRRARLRVDAAETTAKANLDAIRAG
jgi:hypothetical protein